MLGKVPCAGTCRKSRLWTIWFVICLWVGGRSAPRIFKSLVIFFKKYIIVFNHKPLYVSNKTSPELTFSRPVAAFGPSPAPLSISNSTKESTCFPLDWKKKSATPLELLSHIGASVCEASRVQFHSSQGKSSSANKIDFQQCQIECPTTSNILHIYSTPCNPNIQRKLSQMKQKKRGLERILHDSLSSSSFPLRSPSVLIRRWRIRALSSHIWQRQGRSWAQNLPACLSERVLYYFQVQRRRVVACDVIARHVCLQRDITTRYAPCPVQHLFVFMHRRPSPVW